MSDHEHTDKHRRSRTDHDKGRHEKRSSSRSRHKHESRPATPAPVTTPAPPQPPPAPAPDPYTQQYMGPYVGPWAGQRGPGAPPPGYPTFGSGATIYGQGPAMDSAAAGWTATGQYFRAAVPQSPPPLGGGGFGSLLPPASAFAGGQPTAAVSLAQAYQTRLAALSSVAASLLSKREEINHVLAQAHLRMTEVQQARSSVEAETLNDTEAILHRLRTTEAAKLSLLQADTDSLSTDIAAIDAFYGALRSFQPGAVPASAAPPSAGATGTPSATSGAGALYDSRVALAFMRAYPELCAEADRLASKPFRTQVEVPSGDFERETAARLEAARRYEALVEVLSTKDRIILQLLREKEERGKAERHSEQRGYLEREDTFARLEEHLAELTDENAGLRKDLQDAQWQLDQQRALHVTWARERAAAESRIAALTSALESGGGGAPLAPTQLAHWVDLTDRLTSELLDVTDRLQALQALHEAKAAQAAAGEWEARARHVSLVHELEQTQAAHRSLLADVHALHSVSPPPPPPPPPPRVVSAMAPRHLQAWGERGGQHPAPQPAAARSQSPSAVRGIAAAAGSAPPRPAWASALVGGGAGAAAPPAGSPPSPPAPPLPSLPAQPAPGGPAAAPAAQSTAAAARASSALAAAGAARGDGTPKAPVPVATVRRPSRQGAPPAAPPGATTLPPATPSSDSAPEAAPQSQAPRPAVPTAAPVAAATQPVAPGPTIATPGAAVTQSPTPSPAVPAAVPVAAISRSAAQRPPVPSVTRVADGAI